MTILITFEVTQYRARPLGKDMVRKANINGIIHSIIWLWACCWGSVVGGVIIFCWTHIVPPTRMGNNSHLSDIARSSQRKLLFNGTREKTAGQEGYRCGERSKKPAGPVANTRIIDW